MNFFEHQAAARRTSVRLMVLFALAVVGIVIAVDLGMLLAFGGQASAGMLVFSSLATLAIIGLGSLYRIASLRGGGESVALQLGGEPVPEQTSDFNLRRLRNVVEEVAIASGVPVPRIFVLEQEAGINAFAAGYSPSDAVIAVTRGALDRLNRDELQGVIAHEFSHILNGDMRLNIRLIGVLFGILMLALVGKKILQHGRFGGRDNKGAAAILVAALVAMLVGFVGMFFARLIKAGVSRTRERLADASAVQFTRQTSGLAGALKKIGGLEDGSRLSHREDAEEVSHMLFGDGVGLSAWFATHPPLIERIQALEPGFRGEQLEHLRQQWLAAPPDGLDEDARLGLTGKAMPPPLPPTGAELPVSPAGIAARVAMPGVEDYRRADIIGAGIPGELHALAGQRDKVVPLLLALLLDERTTVADKQLFEIAARLGKTEALEVRELHQRHVVGLHPMLRMPLAAVSFPALRMRPRPDLEVFLDAANAMIYADGDVTLFEYCLARLLTVQVRESLNPSGSAGTGRSRLAHVHREIATLLAVVAQYGHTDAEAAKRAYLAGMQQVLPRDALPYLPRTQGVQALDDVWVPLDALEPMAKEALIEGITAAISHDGRIEVAEGELLRTICGVLHCPLPPMHG